MSNSKKLNIVIIGYGTGGMTAAAYAKNTCRECNIIVFEKRPYPVYHPCALPDVIAGYLRPEDVIEHKPLTPGIKVRTSTEVKRIDLNNRRIQYHSVNDEGVVEYDKLILAMGSTPSAPGPLREALKIKDVYTLKTLEDAMTIRRKALSSKEAVVIGAGPIGIETAIALRELGLKVYLIEALSEVLPTALDKDIGSIVRRMLVEEDIEVLVNAPVSEVSRQGDKVLVKASDKQFLVDMVVLATGMKPNSKLAVEAGIKANEKGFIIVDEYLRTSDEDTYAVGDLIQTWDYITRKPTISMLATTAFHQGRIAGINSVGGNEKYPGTLSPFILKTGKIAAGSTGLTKTRAEQLGLKAYSARVLGWDKPHYMPNADKVYVKIVYDDKQRIIGGQVVCRECDVSKYVDIISTLIKLNANVETLIELETSYMPRLSDVYTPLYTAGEAILRRIKRKK